MNVLKRTKHAVVWIETPFRGGTGVVVSPTRVVTSGALVAHGRGPLRVRFHDDRVLETRVLAIDESSGLAVLELSPPTTLQPLPFGEPKRLELGASLLVVGQPEFRYSYSERDRASVRWLPMVAHVGGVDEATVAVVGVSYGHLGAPVIGCDGRLYGVVSRGSWPSASAPVPGEIERVVREAADGGETPGYWRFGANRLGFAADAEPDQAFAGLSAGFSLLGYDRVDLRLEYGSLWAVNAERRINSGFRFFGDLSLGYRWLFKGDTTTQYLIPSVGVGFTADWVRTWEAVPMDEDCTSGPECSFSLSHSSEGHSRGYLLGRLSFITGNVEYALGLRFGGSPAFTGHLVMGFGQP